MYAGLVTPVQDVRIIGSAGNAFSKLWVAERMNVADVDMSKPATVRVELQAWGTRMVPEAQKLCADITHIFFDRVCAGLVSWRCTLIIFYTRCSHSWECRKRVLQAVGFRKDERCRYRNE